MTYTLLFLGILMLAAGFWWLHQNGYIAKNMYTKKRKKKK